MFDLIPLFALLIPIVAILTAHQRKLAEIRAKGASGLSAEVRAELGELKSQITALRDTTTKFDMSFDAAVTRLENRLDRVEERQAVTGSVASDNAGPVTVGRRSSGG